MIIFSLGIGANKVWEKNPLPFWLGHEAREEYLSRVLIGYPMYREANRQLKREDQLYLVNMRNFGYYLDCRWRADFVFESYQLQHFLGATSGSDPLVDFFGSRKITHLLIDEEITRSALDREHQTKLQDYLSRRARLLARDRGQALYALSAPGQSIR